MLRRDFLKSAALLASTPLWAQAAAPSFLIGEEQKSAEIEGLDLNFSRADFGTDFQWGVATAAYQIEGAWNKDGKGESVWDRFTHRRKGKIYKGQNGDVACNFYETYDADIALVKQLGMRVFRFSTAWSRLLPTGTGAVNQKGVDFYKRVIESCQRHGVAPWITMYHWDLPQALEDKGGWANRDVLKWFEEYADLLTRTYGDTVKDWMILNEPAAYTMLGYLGGVHAPGRIAPKKFLAAAHHTTMAMGIGARSVRANVANANVGTTFSCSEVSPKSPRHAKAAARINIMLNRLFVEPVLGMPYPTEDFSFLQRIEKYVQAGDMEKIPTKFDFIGLQNYTRVVARKALVPLVRANQVKPERRKVPYEFITEMDWEVYPQGIYNIIKQFAAYKNCPPIIITENGAAFPDNVAADGVHDDRRREFYQRYLAEVLKAKREGVDIRGYFCWTLMDNFEWAEGYRPRFGLVYVDFETQRRIVKDSGLWFKAFLSE